MADIWITASACSECHRHHDEIDFPESYDPDCDCWCHGSDDDDPGDFEWGA